MPNPDPPHDTVSITIANGDTTSGFVAIGNPTELGLYVPLLTSSTMKVQVARDTAGTGASDVYDGTGTQTLVYAAGTGSFAIGSNHMGACLGYSHIGIVCGTAQGAQRVFRLSRKQVGVDPSA